MGKNRFEVVRVDCSIASISFFRIDIPLYNDVRHSSHWGRSPQNRLGDKWTCKMTLVSAYVLYCLSAAWSQLQMLGRSLRWE